MKNVSVKAGFLIIEKEVMIKFKNIENIKVVDDTITEIPLMQEQKSAHTIADVENPKEETIIGISIEHTNGIEFFETETLEKAEEFFQKIQEAISGENYKH